MGIYANPHKILFWKTLYQKINYKIPAFKQSENVIKTLGSTSSRFSVLSLPLLFIPYDSILLFLFLLLLFSFIGSGYYLQIVYIRKMAALKCKTAGCYLSVLS